MDGVDTRVVGASTSILSGGASIGTGSLSWSVVNPIVSGTTTTLEGVEEAEPVANLVSCSLFKGQ